MTYVILKKGCKCHDGGEARLAPPFYLFQRDGNDVHVCMNCKAEWEFGEWPKQGKKAKR